MSEVMTKTMSAVSSAAAAAAPTPSVPAALSPLAPSQPRPPQARPSQPRIVPSPSELLALTLQSLDDDQAEGPVSIDLAGKSTIADYLVVASGRSTRHVVALAEKLAHRLHEAGLRGIATEGLPHGDWVLIDAGDIIVHLFRPEVRAFYNLEKMWGVAAPALPEPQAPSDHGVDTFDDDEDGQ